MRKFLRFIRAWLRPPKRDGPRLCSICFGLVAGQQAMVFKHRSGKCDVLYLTDSADPRKRSLN